MFYGTGSLPNPEKGLHLIILFKDKNDPLINPYFTIASVTYTEHVGVYLQFFPKKGDSRIWYILISEVKKNTIILLKYFKNFLR